MKRHHVTVLSTAFVLAIAACGGEPPADEAADMDAAAESAPVEATPASSYPDPMPAVPEGANVVEVVAEDYAFEAPDSILSGWTTFRMNNEGEETHFLLLTRLPDDRTFEDYELMGSAFNDVWYRMRDEGLAKDSALMALGAAIPEWYFAGAEVFGGPGMVVPGGVSQVTVELEPGLYVLECFLKTSEGEFHWSEGMLRPMVVVEERSEASAPTGADVRLTMTADGIEAEGEAVAGSTMVELTFADQPDAGFGNDVHVVRLDDDMDPSALVSWMDAFNLDGLRNPAPAPFVGGSHERTEGNTIYFTVDLLPGRYAWFSEGTDATGGIFLEFTVEE